MANDPGPSDWNNPARRYKWFRPRQAFRGGIPSTTAGAGKFATFSLYNSSTGPIVLIVRDWQFVGGSASMVFGYNQGRLAGTAGTQNRLVPGDAAGAGLVDYQAANAALTTTDYHLPIVPTAANQWMHDLPFAVVPPGWAFFLQCSTAATAITGALLWEEIAIDELDYFY